MKIYVEGGGNSEALKSECQRAFNKLFIAAGLEGRMPRIIACGSRNAAYDRFRTEIQRGGNALLLVDSEAAVNHDLQTQKPISPWIHLKLQDRWERPNSASDANVHLMVECMETWFVADKKAFVTYYSEGNRRCNANAIPERDDVESIPKSNVFKCLEDASSPAGKDKYSKGSRSFAILSVIDPRVVATKSFHARRLFSELGVDWVDKKEFENKQEE